MVNCKIIIIINIAQCTRKGGFGKDNDIGKRAVGPSETILLSALETPSMLKLKI